MWSLVIPSTPYCFMFYAGLKKIIPSILSYGTIEVNEHSEPSNRFWIHRIFERCCGFEWDMKYNWAREYYYCSDGLDLHYRTSTDILRNGTFNLGSKSLSWTHLGTVHIKAFSHARVEHSYTLVSPLKACSARVFSQLWQTHESFSWNTASMWYLSD